MNNKLAEAFTTLRKSIRQAGVQFRRNNDNSSSLFHPKGGFIYAYDIPQVEDALDAYEKLLPTEYKEKGKSLSAEETLIRDGSRLVETSKSMEVRDFARTVLAYIATRNARPEPDTPEGDSYDLP